MDEGLENWIARTPIFANELALLVVEMKPDLATLAANCFDIAGNRASGPPTVTSSMYPSLRMLVSDDSSGWMVAQNNDAPSGSPC